MLIDAITFGGELDMLEGRLNSVDADIHVIVEGELMYANQPKGYLLEDNWDRFEKFHDRIIYKQIKSLGSSNAWSNDYHQRSQLTEIVSHLPMDGNDLVSVCDTDEWFERDKIENIENTVAFNMPKYHMSLHWYHKHELTGIAGRWKNLYGQDLNNVRWQREGMKAITNGWHLTSMGSLEYLIKKVRGFAHQELVFDELDKELKHCWINGHDLQRVGGTIFTEIELEVANYPKWITDRKFPSEWYRKRPVDSNSHSE
jgi:beta-1,4-mannosyl-glycoprotein beta-1,4-N-acetylglucosaminyltransferase